LILYPEKKKKMNTYIIIISFLVNLTKSTCMHQYILLFFEKFFCGSFNGNQIKLQGLYKFLCRVLAIWFDRLNDDYSRWVFVFSCIINKIFIDRLNDGIVHVEQKNTCILDSRFDLVVRKELSILITYPIFYWGKYTLSLCSWTHFSIQPQIFKKWQSTLRSFNNWHVWSSIIEFFAVSLMCECIVEEPSSGYFQMQRNYSE
jgi:hypothetical protein